MSTTSPRSLALASRLLAMATGQGEGDPEPGVGRVIQRLHVVLGRLAGAAGSHSLIARALILAQAEMPWLKCAQLSTDAVLTGLDDGLVPADAGERSQGEVVLVAHLLGLLHTFIGERLTLQLVMEAWPDLILESDDDLKDPRS